ncbi:MAG: DUF1499 domain-containing protein [Synechococcaceae cyanobacterium SM2_3_2]|nr:DUF1499 domain-containing protein [Synechococcaceae cyanobacterium SM2_3_2]
MISSSIRSSLWKGMLAMVGIAFLGVMLMALPGFAAGSSGNQARQEIVVNYSAAAVMAAAPQAFQQWDRGELLEGNGDTPNQVKGISRTKFFKFVDDITVSITPDSQDPSRTVVALNRSDEWASMTLAAINAISTSIWPPYNRC